MANRRGKGRSSGRVPLLGLQNHWGRWLQPWNQKTIASWQGSNDKSRLCWKAETLLCQPSSYSQGCGLSNGQKCLWELDHKEGSSGAQLCPTLCNPMDCSMPGLPVHHQLPELTQTHVHLVGDAIQPSHPLSSPFPPAPNPSQHQGLFQWVNSSHEVANLHIVRYKKRILNQFCWEHVFFFFLNHISWIFFFTQPLTKWNI